MEAISSACEYSVRTSRKCPFSLSSRSRSRTGSLNAVPSITATVSHGMLGAPTLAEIHDPRSRPTVGGLDRVAVRQERHQAENRVLGKEDVLDWFIRFVDDFLWPKLHTCELPGHTLECGRRQGVEQVVG